MHYRNQWLLSLALLSAVALMAGLTVGLGPRARLVPVQVLIPAIILLLLQLLIDLLPLFNRWAKRRKGPTTAAATAPVLQRLLAKLRCWSEGLENRMIPLPGQAETAAGVDAKRELAAIAWLLVLPAAIGLGGFLVAVPAYVAAYLRWRAKQSLPVALIGAEAAWVVLYGGFVLLLRVSLYPGVFR